MPPPSLCGARFTECARGFLRWQNPCFINATNSRRVFTYPFHLRRKKTTHPQHPQTRIGARQTICRAAIFVALGDIRPTHQSVRLCAIRGEKFRHPAWCRLSQALDFFCEMENQGVARGRYEDSRVVLKNADAFYTMTHSIQCPTVYNAPQKTSPRIFSPPRTQRQKLCNALISVCSL